MYEACLGDAKVVRSITSNHYYLRRPLLLPSYEITLTRTTSSYFLSSSKIFVMKWCSSSIKKLDWRMPKTHWKPEIPEMRNPNKNYTTNLNSWLEASDLNPRTHQSIQWREETEAPLLLICWKTEILCSWFQTTVYICIFIDLKRNPISPQNHIQLTWQTLLDYYG